MQTQNRPQPTKPLDLDRWHPAQTTLPRCQVAPDDKPRERRLRIERFGPLPGEVYADEAHFGSFN